MRPITFLILPLFLTAACSETNLDDLDQGELDEIEKQVTEDAQSLEEAADEAVKVLEQEVRTELDDDGVSASVPPPTPADVQEVE
ncbi:MAG: hypothetical protein ABJN65_03880 [Parasphingorhabdus sp.]